MKRTALLETQCLYSILLSLILLWDIHFGMFFRVCIFHLYLYTPYGPYGLYSTSVPVQYIFKSTPTMGRTECTETQCQESRIILLNPLWLYRLYIYSMPLQHIYTSTPPMGRTSCPDPQCLYSTALFLFTLWAVRTVQNLSTCRIPQNLYSPYGPYRLYRASDSVEYSYNIITHGTYRFYRIPVPVHYFYTSTSPMRSTDCTESKCL